MGRRLGALLAATVFSFSLGCEYIDDTGGGGGIGGTVNFVQGFVFVRKDDRNLYIADKSDYAANAKLTTSGGVRHPSLSRDGKRVVFVHGSGADSELVVVASAGGTPTVVLPAASGRKNLRTPVFSPDGSKIAYAFDDGTGSAIGVVGADGSNDSKLVPTGASSLSFASPSFYPDGKNVLAIAGNNPASYDQLVKVSLDTGSVVESINNLGTEATNIANRAVISPDGAKAAFDGQLSTSLAARIFVIDLASKKVNRLTEYPSDTGANDGFPTWVGSGQVGFSSDTGGADQVYVLSSSTPTPTSGGLQVPSAIEPWFGPN